jgi:hypothetical protein
MSYRVSVRNPGRLANTSSRYVPTPLELLVLKSSSPMPRMRKSGVESVVEFMVERLGAIIEKLSGCWMRSASNSLPLAVSMATPTSCTSWLRLWAVTTTSSRTLFGLEARSASLAAAGAAMDTSSAASDRQIDSAVGINERAHERTRRSL